MSVERILFENNQVKIFKNPKKRETDQTYKAASWPLHSPNWRGSLQVIASDDNELFINMDETETGVSFGKCLIDKYPGPAVETVVDSSRYFVLRFFNNIGQTAYLGIGFENRNESSEFSAAIQNYFKKPSPKKKTSPKKDAENNACKELVLKNTSSNGNLFGRQFIDSLADKMMEKYGKDTDNRDVIDLSCMQVVKKRRRSIPVKYASLKAEQQSGGKKRSKTITFTQQEVINVMPSTSSRTLPAFQAPCTTIARMEDTTVSCFVSDKHFNRVAASNQEFQSRELDELYKALLQGDAEIADLLCCVVNTTMKGAACLTPEIPIPKLPPHSLPLFRFDKNRVPFFIMIFNNPQSRESPARQFKDLNDDIIQKSSLIYQLLLKHQSSEGDQSEREQSFENTDQQKTLLLQYLKKLLQDSRAVEAARQNLEALYGNELPNPGIFDVIVTLDGHNKPLFNFYAFPKTASFDLSDSLPNYDPTIHCYSKSIYELIYQSNRSSSSTTVTTTVASSVSNPRTLRM